MTKHKKTAFVAADTDEAQKALERLKTRYPNVPAEDAAIIVALGGDGFMLETLHATLGKEVAVYGMNLGSVGFLMNEFDEDGLMDRLSDAQALELRPLVMEAETLGGDSVAAIAINEVSLLRETRQTAKVKIWIDDVERLSELVCDGVMVATAAGSTAYNLSAHGAIIPLGAGLLALTPISAFRPRRWRGALLPEKTTIRFDVIEPEKRPVSAVADSTEVRDVANVVVRQSTDLTFTLLFDPEHNLEERIIKEQFLP